MRYFEQIEAMHQQVRVFMEENAPMYRVVSIDGYTTTDYQQTLESQHEISPMRAEFVLSEIQARFTVNIRSLTENKRLSCDIFVTSEGQLHIADQVSVTIGE